jgi:hypothetical protein
MDSLDLLMNDSENVGGRVASLELEGKWMCEKIGLCAFFVLFQGIIQNQLEIGGWDGGGVSVRHEEDVVIQ